MNAVIYYSAAGESKNIAEYVANKTGYELKDVLKNRKYDYGTAVVVFPVYCQSMPRQIKKFLSLLKTERLVIIAAYGKKWHGNVLYDIQREYKHTVIAAAYVPTKHAYINEPHFDEFDRLTPIIGKINGNDAAAVTIPRAGKNPFAKFAPSWRSRAGIFIRLDKKLCNGCKTCNAVCPEHAINCGEANRKCIRCTKCIVNCPQKALSLRATYIMRMYLRKKKYNDLKIYV